MKNNYTTKTYYIGGYTTILYYLYDNGVASTLEYDNHGLYERYFNTEKELIEYLERRCKNNE